MHIWTENNCTRVVKPYCHLLLLPGCSPHPVSTVEVELEELLNKLTFRQKTIVVECF